MSGAITTTLDTRVPQPGQYADYGVPRETAQFADDLLRQRNFCADEDVAKIDQRILVLLSPWFRRNDIGKFTVEPHNLDGRGSVPTRCYAMRAVKAGEYWPSVTDVPCPCCQTGTIRWAENGYVAGYRICDGCGRHFLAAGDAINPKLLRVGARREPVGSNRLVTATKTK